MATANGYWRLPSPHISRVPTFGAPKQKKQRNHHYTFDVDDNGLDINGFILHTDKHKGKRQKFRVYLDSNENERFDKSDRLIGRTGLKQKHAAKGVGNLLDEDELGQLEVKFKKTKSNASMRADEDHTVPNMLGSSGGDGAEQRSRKQHFGSCKDVEDKPCFGRSQHMQHGPVSVESPAPTPDAGPSPPGNP